MSDDFNNLLHKFRDKKKKEKAKLRNEVKEPVLENPIKKEIHAITWKEVFTNQNYLNCLICYKEFRDDDIVADCPTCGTFYHHDEYIDWMNANKKCVKCHSPISDEHPKPEDILISQPSIEKQTHESEGAYKVFISYSSTNEKTANKILDYIENSGIKCWIAPRDILPSASYAQEIIKGIMGSQVLLILFSNSSNKSQHVVREVELAVSNRIRLLPVRIENIEPTESMKYFLSTTHWLNAFEPVSEESLNQIVKVLNTIVI